MPDVVVVGAGIVGAAVACRLAESGASVVVLERRRPAAGATSTSFAWTNAHNKPPRPYHDLNTAGVAEHHRLAAETGGEWFHATGCLQWAVGSARIAALQAGVARLQEWGYRAELIDRSRAEELETDLLLPAAADAAFAFYADEGWVEAPVLTHHLLETAVRAGAGVKYPGEVTSLALEAGRVVGVVTGADVLHADLVLDCTGREAGVLLASLGLGVARQRSPGLLVATEPVPTCLARVVLGPELNLRPDGAGRVLLQATALDGALPSQEEPHAEPHLCDELLARGAAVLPVLAGVRIEAVRLGLRAMPGDGFSAVGPVPGAPGYYLVFTHSGVTLGPLLGRLVAEEVLSGQPSPLLAGFRPDRLIVARSSAAQSAS